MCEDVIVCESAALEPHPYFYGSVMTSAMEDQLWDAARDLIKRNKDAEETVEGVLNRYAARYLEKARYFKPKRGTIEQFLGVIVGNVNAELIPDLVATQERRREVVWIDKALDLHGDQVTSDQIFCETIEARRMRDLIATDVHDTLSMMDESERRIGDTFIKVGGVNETARALGLDEATFKTGPWPRFKRHFRRLWELDGVCKNFTNSTPNPQSL